MGFAQTRMNTAFNSLSKKCLQKNVVLSRKFIILQEYITPFILKKEQAVFLLSKTLIRTFDVLRPVKYNKIVKEDCRMKKTKLYLSEAEWRLVVHSLNDLKTKLHKEGRYTDAVDDTMLKVMKAPVKKVKPT